jgi:hypothetical protein
MAAIRQRQGNAGLDPTDAHKASIVHDGYAFVQGAEMREMLARIGSLTDWDTFASSWDDLEVDSYLVSRI